MHPSYHAHPIITSFLLPIYCGATACTAVFNRFPAIPGWVVCVHGASPSRRFAAGTRVLKSASELFAVIKKSLLRCSKYITRGAAMLALMGAFQVCTSQCCTPMLAGAKS